MKVLSVNMSIDPVTGGGTAERTVQVSKHLAKAGIESSLLTSDIGVTPSVLEGLAGVNLTILPCILPRFYIPKLDYRQMERLVSRVDIVHVMNHWTLLNCIIHKICTKLGKPYVVCPAGALPIYGRSKVVKRVFNALIGTKIIKNASGHIAIPSEETYQYIPYGVNPQTVEVIPNGINPQDFVERDDESFRDKYQIGQTPFILFMGRLNDIKGPDLLLHAFARFKDKYSKYKLVFAGPDDGLLNRLRNTCRKENVADRVRFIGYIGGKEKSWAYHAADLLAVPSRQEAMSIVAVEAGITGTPVLMTDVCGFNQIEQIGGGIIVKPTITGIGDGLSILECPTRLKEMGGRIKRFVSKHYTWDSVIKKYILFLETILKTR